MDWIEPGLALGDLDDALAHDRLRTAGIRSILTVSDFPCLGLGGFVWRHIPLIDGPGNSVASVRRAVDELAVLHREASAVLVHCAAGKNRSVLVLALYLARRHALSFESAYARVKAARPIANIDDALVELGQQIVTDTPGMRQ